MWLQQNLAVVFNSVIFGQDQVPADGNVMNMHLEKVRYALTCIDGADR